MPARNGFQVKFVKSSQKQPCRGEKDLNQARLSVNCGLILLTTRERPLGNLSSLVRQNRL